MTFLAPSWSEKLGYSAMNDRQLIASLLQGGVIGAGDMKCSAGSGFQSIIAAGRSAVEGSFQTAQGLYIVQNSGVVSVTHGTPSPSLPRIDQIGVKVYDSTDGGDVSDKAEALVLEGTPTSGATLGNRSGAALVLPANFLRFADVLVPAGAGSAASFTYRDRRPWARGAYCWGETGGSPTVTSVTPATFSEPKFRIEQNGVLPIRFTLNGTFSCTSATTIKLGIEVDGGRLEFPFFEFVYPTANVNTYFSLQDFNGINNAGSHLIQVWGASGAGTLKLNTGSWLTIEEVLKPSENNGNS